MPQLTLITGAPAALDEALAAEIRRHKGDDPLAPVTVVTGGTLLRPFLRARLAVLLAGHINVRVVTPAELALRLGEPALIAAGRTPITPLADRALAQELARHAESYFEPVRETPGFANAVHRLFGELRAASVSPQQFAAAATDTKQRELAGLYRGYLEARSLFYDAGDAMAAPDAARLDDCAVLLYGVWEAPPRLRSLIEAIAERVPVTVLLPLSGSVADDAHGELREWLASRGADADELDTPPTLNALGTLQRQLFLEAPAPATPDDTVALVSAPDAVREARDAVRTCLRWAENGIGFHEMAIAYRNGREYGGLIDQALREAGIPFYLHEGTPLSERPLGRQALALLDLFDSTLPRAEVMQFLADARLPDVTWERYGGVSGASWDRLSREAGVVEGPAQWRERLALLSAELAARARDEDNAPEWLHRRIEDVERLARFVADLAAVIERRPKSATWAEQLAYLAEVFGTYIADAERLVGALATLADLDALGEPVSAQRFVDVVTAAIDGLRVNDVLDERQGAFARRGVNVLDVNSLRGLSFRAVAIVGLVERSFPPPPRQDPLLLDDEREELASAHDVVLPLRARGADSEALQFALACAAAEGRLQLSFARAQGAGERSQLPSRFFRDAARALTGERVRADRVDELPAWVYRRILANRLLGEDLWHALSLQEYERAMVQQQPLVGVALLERSAPTLKRALTAQAARWDTRELTAFDGVLGEAALPALLQKMGPERPLSPTGLESYAKCPYQFFLEKVLGLKELEEPEAVERIDALTRGSLIHRILQRFLEGLGDRRPTAAQRDGDQARLREIALEECELVEQRGLTGYPALWRHDRRSLLEDLVSWYDVELEDPAPAGYDQAAYEVRFGQAWADEETSAISIDDPIEIDADGTRLRLHGRIDRLEWSSERPGMRIIDYKTGSTYSAPKDDTVKGGRALQLPLYLLAAGQLLDQSPQAGLAQYFYPTRRGDFKRSEFHGAALGADGADVMPLLGSLLKGIRSGDFHAEPGDCKFCDFDGLCDSSRELIRERKAADPRAIAVTERRENHP